MNEGAPPDTGDKPRERKPWLHWLGKLARDEESALGALEAYRSLNAYERDELITALEEDAPEADGAMEMMLVPFVTAESDGRRKGRLVQMLRADRACRTAFCREDDGGWTCILRFRRGGFCFTLPPVGRVGVTSVLADEREYELRAKGFTSVPYDDAIDELALRVFRRKRVDSEVAVELEPFAHLFGALRDAG
jgi:hypothetical protein